MLGGLLKGRPARPTRPKDPLDAAIFDAEARVSVTTENLRDADRRAQEAHAALTRATAAGRAAVARYDAVCLDTPADAKKLAEADEASKKARRALEAARTAAIDADAALHAVQRAHAEAGEELSRARHAKRTAELCELASPERFHAAVAPAVARAYEAIRVLEEAAVEIDAALASSGEASARLLKAGEGGRPEAQPLHWSHIVLALGFSPEMARSNDHASEDLLRILGPHPHRSGHCPGGRLARALLFLSGRERAAPSEIDTFRDARNPSDEWRHREVERRTNHRRPPITEQAPDPT